MEVCKSPFGERSGLEAARRCVYCGMCLPVCPTYGLAREESESPRGRIALIRALGEGQLAPGPRMLRHLDSCVQCRRCESMCPAGVPFGALMDQAQARVWPRRPARARWQLLAARGALMHPRLFRVLRPAAMVVHALRRMRLWPARRPRALALFPAPRKPVAGGPHRDATGPTVALFRGCVAEFADQDTLSAALLLLTEVGFRVVEPEGQVCCGALHRHAGDLRSAARFMQRNRACFAAVRAQAMVSTATGCGAVFAEDVAGEPGGGGSALGPVHQDVVHFLARAIWPRTPRFRPLEARVFVHAPCSLAHAGSSLEEMLQLLARIPGAQWVPGMPRRGCCGAGGRYMLTHPSNADALASALLEQVFESGADRIVTANIGCRLHLEAALRRAGRDMEVLHPVTLLARQLEARILEGDSSA